ncbi:MAG: saccharopine dehydrogenase NADP-binding domain-containing protein [Anaerolineae bacterium]|nr:saccharopine dehydrogenase NADP-binding domain-containing protein [Anaerolineae bacterium]
MITLFGATGYTGRLVARALDRTGLPYRIAGRSAGALADLSESLVARPSWVVVDVERPETLARLFEGTRVLANTVGPFTDLGEPVVARAAASGVHYLDTTNELGYVYQVQSYDSLARRTGAAIVPSCAFEVTLSDCAAELAARDLATPVDEVSITYHISGGGSSLGTRRSAVRSLATSWLAYRKGQWVRSIPGRYTRQVDLPRGTRTALSFPSSETVTLPAHLAVRDVSTWMVISHRAGTWAPLLVPAFARLARTPFGSLVEALIAHVLPPPDSGLRSDAPFTVQVTACTGDKVRRFTLTGEGVYDLTADIVAYAAGTLHAADHHRAGVLPPALALDPDSFLTYAAGQWSVQIDRSAG